MAKVTVMPPVEAKMLMMQANDGRPYWAIPDQKQWQIMTPQGAQMLVVPVPPEILTQMVGYIKSKEEPEVKVTQEK